MGVMRNSCKILGRRPKRKRPCWRLWHRWKG